MQSPPLSTPPSPCSYECADCCLPGLGVAKDIKGSFDIHGRLQGPAKIAFSAGAVVEANYRHGVLHGMARYFQGKREKTQKLADFVY